MAKRAGIVVYTVVRCPRDIQIATLVLANGMGLYGNNSCPARHQKDLLLLVKDLRMAQILPQNNMFPTSQIDVNSQLHYNPLYSFHLVFTRASCVLQVFPVLHNHFSYDMDVLHSLSL